MTYAPYSPQLAAKYTLTGPSGRKAVFNDPLDTDYVGMVFDLSGLDSAEIRESADELVEADGGQHGNFYFGRRPITMGIRVFGHATIEERDTRIDKLRAITKECMRADGVLSWQNVSSVLPNPFQSMQTWVRIQQPFRDAGGWVKELQLAMVSQYAPLFSQTLHTQTTTGNTTIENKGDYPAYPILRFTGQSPAGTINPRATDGHGGDFRTTGLTLASGEIVEFDMLNHIGNFTAGARSGQSANRYIDFAATVWPSLVRGNNTFTLTPNGSLTILWRDTWG